MWLQVSGQSRKLVRVAGLHAREEFPVPRLPAARRVTGDPSGGIWLGLINGGLARYRDERLELFAHDAPSNSAAVEHVNHVEAVADGTVLAASGRGLIELRNGVYHVLDSRNGLPCNRLFVFTFDARGDLWLYLECALVRVTAAELEAWRHDRRRRLELDVFDSADGAYPAIAPFTPGVARSTDGRVWFANQNGAQMIDPARIPKNAIAPPVHIESVIADRRSYEIGQPIKLPPLTRDLQIDYTALSFVAPKEVTFRYKLSGHDEEWQHAGSRRQAFYNDLRPGDYRFHVIACNNDGVCNEAGASFEFQVKAAFHQTLWFVALVLAGALALVWLLFAWRMRQIMTRLRTRLEERERIARELHDTFLQGVQGLMLKFQTAMERIPEDQPARDLMERALDRADAVLAEGRARVAELRRSTQARDDLPEALRALVQQAAADAADVRLVVEGVPRSVHPVVAEEAHRIMGEALNNAIRHAQARVILVELIYLRSELIVRVEDDGRGFSTELAQKAEANEHWGLTGMRERAAKIRGRLEIASRPGAGTAIELRIKANIAYRNRRGGRAGRVSRSIP